MYKNEKMHYNYIQDNKRQLCTNFLLFMLLYPAAMARRVRS